MEYKILFGIVLMNLILVSFVSADIIVFPKPDKTPPVISNVQANSITENSADISWETDETTCSNWVEYGLDTSYGTAVSVTSFCGIPTNSTISDTVTEHSIPLTNLNENTTYHYRVSSCDMNNNCASSSDYNFTTTSPPQEPSLPIFIGTPAVPHINIGDSHIFGVQVYHPDGDPLVIKWYVNSELVSTSLKEEPTGPPLGVTDEYNFTATSAGTYNFKVVAHKSESLCLIIMRGEIICPNSNSIEFNVYVAPNIIIIPIDTTPPVISNVQSVLMGNTLYIRWETNEPSHFNKLEYGRGKEYEYSSPLVLISINFSDPTINTMFAPLTLDKSGNYHYKVTSCDLFNNCAYSEDYKIKKE